MPRHNASIPKHHEGRDALNLQSRRQVPLPFRVHFEHKSRARHLTRTEGIIPALESSHALAYTQKLAPRMARDQVIVVNLSGRGDKDMHTVATIDGITL